MARLINLLHLSSDDQRYLACLLDQNRHRKVFSRKSLKKKKPNIYKITWVENRATKTLELELSHKLIQIAPREYIAVKPGSVLAKGNEQWRTTVKNTEDLLITLNHDGSIGIKRNTKKRIVKKRPLDLDLKQKQLDCKKRDTKLNMQLGRPTSFMTNDAQTKSYIVTTKIPGITLAEMLEQMKSGTLRLTFGERIHLINNLLWAVHCFHLKTEHIHCDLKPSNLLVDKKGYFHLIDFEVALKAPFELKIRDEATKDHCEQEIHGGTWVYASPELLLEKDIITFPSDVYTVSGIILRILGADALKARKESGLEQWPKTHFSSDQLFEGYEVSEEDKTVVEGSLQKAMDLDQTKRPSVPQLIQVFKTMSPLILQADLKKLVTKTQEAIEALYVLNQLNKKPQIYSMILRLEVQKNLMNQKLKDRKNWKHFTRGNYETFYTSTMAIFNDPDNKKALGLHRNRILSFFNTVTRPLSLLIGSIAFKTTNEQHGYNLKTYGFFKLAACAKCVSDTSKGIHPLKRNPCLSAG
jgi:serine/threonine protein kinase